MDKAPGSLRCAKALVGVKLAYPDRVVLLLGNRDINKMRFTSVSSLCLYVSLFLCLTLSVCVFESLSLSLLSPPLSPSLSLSLTL